MPLGRKKEELSVMEAIDALSNMAEIDLVATAQAMPEGGETSIDWCDPKSAIMNEPLIKEVFRVIHRYLQNMVRNEMASLADPKTLKGIQAILLIADEAVNKMDQYVAIYPEKYHPISKLKEYTDLKKYYEQQILRQLPKSLEIPEDWEEGFTEGGGVGILTLQQVREDQNYELFFIKDEKGEFFFSTKLLRHIRLIGNIEELIRMVEGDDPLLKIEEFYDWEMYEGAKEVLQRLTPLLDPFYKKAMKEKERPYVGDLNKAVMALRMASSPKNLMENKAFKSCLEYYGDFHFFLRRAMKTPGYLQLVNEEGKDPFSRTLRQLTHAFCGYFFLRTEPRKEALKLIDALIDEGSSIRGGKSNEKAQAKELQLWVDLCDQDQSLRKVLTHYPNGPIMKTLSIFREEMEYEGYDPLLHQNFPAQLFSFEQGDFHVTLIRLPSPTMQRTIKRAEIVSEFKGFLHFYQKEIKPDKHLLISLEEARSWNNQARAHALEELAQDPAFAPVFNLGRFPKDTDFYFQEGEYAQVGGAPVFMEQLFAQVMGKASCGFLFPKAVQEKELLDFSKKAIDQVHKLFFDGKTSLMQGERLDFIEIFYQLLTLKLIELTGCDSISFTCRDGLDKAAAQNALFFGFLRLLKTERPFEQEEKDLLFWALYSPALLNRERAIKQKRFTRVVSALKTAHQGFLKHHKKAHTELSKLYKKFSVSFDLHL